MEAERTVNTEDRRTILADTAQQWIHHITSTTPAARFTVENAVDAWYRANGWEPPSRIVWGRSPTDLAYQHSMLINGASTEKRGIGSMVYRRVYEQLADAMLAASLWDEKLVDDMDLYWLDWEIRPYDLLGDGFGWGDWNILTGHTKTFCARLEAASRLGYQLPDGLEALLTIESQVFWFLPHAYVAFLLDRPVEMRYDDDGTRIFLHSTDEPALVWGDDSKAYYVRGRRVAPWVVECQQPSVVLHYLESSDDADRFDAREAVELMGWRPFLMAASPLLDEETQPPLRWEMFHVPDSYTKHLYDPANAVIETWVEGSHRPSDRCLFVPAECETIEQARAWMFGVPAEIVARVERVV